MGVTQTKEIKLYFACKYNKLENVKKLLKDKDKDFNINKLCGFGYPGGKSPLEIACIFNNNDCVMLLLLDKRLKLDKDPNYCSNYQVEKYLKVGSEKFKKEYCKSTFFVIYKD